MNNAKCPAPFIKSPNGELLTSLDFFIAALPLVIWSAIAYGLRTVAVVLIAMLSAMLFELLYALILKGGSRVPTAAWLGLLCSLFMPAGVNYLFVPVTSFIAITLRRFTGGIINPVAGALIPLFFLTDSMAKHTAVFGKLDIGVIDYSDKLDTLGARSVLECLQEGVFPAQSPLDIFLGKAPESIGGMSALLLLLGGAYLLMRRAISWHNSVGFAFGAVVLWFVFCYDGAHYDYMIYDLCAGGLILGAVFGASEYSSSPLTPTGKFIYGTGCGLLTMIFRELGFYAESVLLSLLVMSLFSRLIDMLTAERYFGYNGKKIFERLGAFIPSFKKK